MLVISALQGSQPARRTGGWDGSEDQAARLRSADTEGGAGQGGQRESLAESGLEMF